MRIKKGDNVKIISGKDRGKTGKVTKVIKESGRLVVLGVNVSRKHMAKKAQNKPGQIIQIAMPIDASNAAIICGACGKATRVGMVVAQEKKIRVCKKCGAEFK
ncbi:MAG TPA: 50S ribosomal protein L24 [Candidatus Paceibacterota bacterium]